MDPEAPLELQAVEAMEEGPAQEPDSASDPDRAGAVIESTSDKDDKDEAVYLPGSLVGPRSERRSGAPAVPAGWHSLLCVSQVLIKGNARTKNSLHGQRAMVSRVQGLGGWHWLVSPLPLLLEQFLSPRRFDCEWRHHGHTSEADWV